MLIRLLDAGRLGTPASSRRRAARDGSPPALLPPDAATALGRKIMSLSAADHLEVWVNTSVRVVTTLANGEVAFSDDGEHASVDLRASFGGRRLVELTVNVLNDRTIESAVRRLDSMAKVQPGPPESLGEIQEGPHPTPVVNLWFDATRDAMTAARESALAALLDGVAAKQLVGAGFLALVARSTFVTDRSGLSAYYRETDSQCTVTAMTPDRSGSGWAGQMARDWRQIDPHGIAERAVEMGARSGNPVAIEPGRRTVILSATACAQLMSALAYAFDARATDTGQTPFSNGWRPGNKLGRRVFDPRIEITSDPNDPDGGYIPFYYGEIDRFDSVTGLPLGSITWVDRGVLTNLQYGVRYGAQHGKAYNRLPLSMRVAPVAGTTTMRVEEMIASCDEGIFVNRFATVAVVDGKTGVMTGVTRDGCLHVQHGQIKHAVKNFRFVDSPLFFLNNLEAIGTPERVAIGLDFGNTASFPMIVPAVMVRDFNFTSLSEAV